MPLPTTTPESPRADAHPLAWPGVTHWERMYALALHVSVLLFHTARPVLPALVLWLCRRKRSRFIDDHGRQTINFQLTLLVYGGATAVLTVVTCGAAAYILGPAVYILGWVGTILACIATHRGRAFRYPMTIPFLASAV